MIISFTVQKWEKLKITLERMPPEKVFETAEEAAEYIEF
jgi:hypothetical protein